MIWESRKAEVNRSRNGMWEKPGLWGLGHQQLSDGLQEDSWNNWLLKFRSGSEVTRNPQGRFGHIARRNNYRQFRSLYAGNAQDVKPVHVGQPNVENEQIKAIGVQGLNGGATGRNSGDSVAFSLQ
ncbi:hypothetical protein SBA3_880003 [Candidatus Sulfopaludibacter sp. SbA3]|nr:hypothetical protein SBA3_880003 [Candidatus Sulfopaludibacter sp. SbA3]